MAKLWINIGAGLRRVNSGDIQPEMGAAAPHLSDGWAGAEGKGEDLY
jgi:hypothetical protein